MLPRSKSRSPPGAQPAGPGHMKDWPEPVGHAASSVSGRHLRWGDWLFPVEAGRLVLPRPL